ncbi:hypothetical protein BJF77_15735 [Kocuria sp. CNJ-770]|nr:hypothetical protein BJF77_15735 [Kocuria sp. CNJ-770]
MLEREPVASGVQRGSHWTSPNGSLVMLAVTASQDLGGSKMKQSWFERVPTGACARMPAANGVAGAGADHAVRASILRRSRP